MTAGVVSPGMTTMSMPTRAHGGHGFQLFHGQAPHSAAWIMPSSSTDGDEGAGQAAHVVGGHHAALLDRVVQQGQRRPSCRSSRSSPGPISSRMFATLNRPRRGRGRQRQVHDAGGHAQPPRRRGSPTSWPTRVILNAVRLTSSATVVHAGRPLGSWGQRRAHRARAGDAHVDHAVRLARAVERARHEGVVLRRVAEDDQLGRARCTDGLPRAAHAASLTAGAHQLDGVHVQARSWWQPTFTAAAHVCPSPPARAGMDCG